MQILGDVRRQLHSANKDKKHPEQQRQRLQHDRTHLPLLNCKYFVRKNATHLSHHFLFWDHPIHNNENSQPKQTFVFIIYYCSQLPDVNNNTVCLWVVCFSDALFGDRCVVNGLAEGKCGKSHVSDDAARSTPTESLDVTSHPWSLRQTPPGVTARASPPSRKILKRSCHWLASNAELAIEKCAFSFNKIDKSFSRGPISKLIFLFDYFEYQICLLKLIFF